jgi:hypothetical protein
VGHLNPKRIWVAHTLRTLQRRVTHLSENRSGWPTFAQFAKVGLAEVRASHFSQNTRVECGRVQASDTLLRHGPSAFH